MNTLRLDTMTKTGRRVAVWRSTPSQSAPGRPIAVVAPGFGRTMADLASLSLYLTANGVTTYRFDPLDHVGLSDGNIGDYTLGATLESYRAVLRVVRTNEAWCPVTVVGVSMSARAALRAAYAPNVRRLVSLVGVVDVVATLSEVIGPGLITGESAALPETVDFEIHSIRPHALHAECHNGWGSIEGTVREMAGLTIPAIAVYAIGDPWVPACGVRRVFRPDGRGLRRIFGVPANVHDLGLDPTAALTALEALTGAVCGTDPLEPGPVLVPSVDELLETISAERLWETNQRQVIDLRAHPAAKRVAAQDGRVALPVGM